MIRTAAALLVSLAAGCAFAQSVALQGMLGRKALLIVDGSEPRSVAPGESFKGVKVLSTAGDTATVEVSGRQLQLRVGELPASVGSNAGAPGSGTRVVLTSQEGGHFMTGGRINGQQVHFMVDTGATMVALSENDAKRLGIRYKEQGQLGRLSTANGMVTAWKIKLSSVAIGDVEIREVDATVVPAEMPFVLLGNSFLSRFSMKRDNDVMVLDRRY